MTDSSTQPIRSAKALLERLDQVERDVLRYFLDEFRVPLAPNRTDLAAEAWAYVTRSGRVEDAHRYLDRMGVA